MPVLGRQMTGGDGFGSCYNTATAGLEMLGVGLPPPSTDARQGDPLAADLKATGLLPRHATASVPSPVSAVLQAAATTRAPPHGDALTGGTGAVGVAQHTPAAVAASPSKLGVHVDKWPLLPQFHEGRHGACQGGAPCDSHALAPPPRAPLTPTHPGSPHRLPAPDSAI
jgi:hypothetical protein